MRVKITNWKKLSASIFIVGAVFALLSLQTKAASQSDAIAVRIMPNVNHDSIDTWYAKQGYKGSPQSLIVDGYEAIRDGRTVFVNAANLDKTTTPKSIYTNIYLISYNQESETNTSDILGQLVSHWKFNSNAATTGECSISTLNCQADTDCPSGYMCSTSGETSYGKCVLKTYKICLIDSDCPVNLFCDSLKARSIRDVKRLGELNQINSAIESAKATNGNYPSLPSGTYISGTSMSVWPSWKETLWAELGLSQLLVDPINTLGYCNGFDATTCWNNTNNSFVNSNLTLPVDSYAFVYTAAKNGINYSLCSVFETKNLGYDTLDKKISANACSESENSNGSNTNTAPYVVSSYTDGEAGKEFNGYIKVKDDQGDLISWNLRISSPSSWINSGWQAGANIAPVLQDTGDSNQKKIYAPKAGNPGTYDMILTLTDSRGATASSRVMINISAAGKPRIEAEDINYFVDPINPLEYTFTVEGNNSKPTYTITALNSSFTEINRAVTRTSAIITSVGLNKNKVDLSTKIDTPFTQDITVPFRITATADGASSSKDVNFNFKIEKPYLDFNCENMARINQPYQITGSTCLLGSLKSGNHTLKYTVSGPDYLYVEETGSNAYLKADRISAPDPVESTVKIKVTNEHGATNEKSFNLKLNTFCGDNLKQTPNSEGRGGLNNDGMEECDGSEGIQTATSTISTSSAIQYGCTTEDGANPIYPIINNNSCVFKPADDGGGYCGDGVCQFKINVKGNSVPMENCWNCQQDCGTCLATVTSKADYVQSTFYNGQFLYKTVTPGSNTKTLTLASGKNVFGFWSHFLNNTTSLGLSFKVTMGANGIVFKEFNTYNTAPLLSCTTTGITNNSTYDSNYDPSVATGAYTNWNGLTYESTWASPYLVSPENKFQGLPYIWSQGGSITTNDQMYCRLAFDYKPYSFEATCKPECKDKNCGSDGCGGYCGVVGGNGTCKETQKCLSGVCVCNPNCNGRVCGSNGCGGVCGTVVNGSCLDANRWAWYNTSDKNFGWKQMNKPQKCENGQCVCKPDCTNKTCGDDGCGGFCGACGTGEACNQLEQCQPKCLGLQCGANPFDGASCGTCSSGACIDGQCTSGKTNIQVSADNGHTTYLNGVEISGKTPYTNPTNTTKEATGHDWTKIPATLSMNNLSQGENVFAVWATNDASSGSKNSCNGNKYGFSATLNVFVGSNATASIKMTTDDNSGWKCSDSKAGGYEWQSDSDFYANGSNSDWISAKDMGNTGPSAPGNSLPYKQIWWNGTYSNNCAESSVYCRYTFNTDNIKDLPCTKVCSGKCSGPDSCGGLCYSTCPSGQVCGAITPNVCGVKTTCTSNCAAGVCGGDDGCGGICPKECTSGTCGGAGVYNQCG